MRGPSRNTYGDGFVALFGAPMAYEDHARWGVLAALDCRRRLREHGPRLGHTASEALAVGIGLHTGLVVVGARGEDGRGLFTAVGPTTHLATHLQHLAEPGIILLLSEAMCRLLAKYVNVELFGQPCTTDQTVSAPAYKLIGLAPRRSPVVQREGRVLSRFVGRQREFAALHTLLAQAESGQGQVVGMVGEVGLGKSRLLDEFRQSLQGRAVTPIWKGGASRMEGRRPICRSSISSDTTVGSPTRTVLRRSPRRCIGPSRR